MEAQQDSVPALDAPPTMCEILVIGAGLSGICAGIQFAQNNMNDFLILERAHDVGGTWRDHQYPGLTIDIPSLTYSYSFEQKPDWSSLWAPQAEMLEYCQEVTDKHRLRDHIRFGEVVVGAEFDEPTRTWVTTTATGSRYVSRFLVNASGFLNTPRWPDIPGIESFSGQKLHTSQWSPETDVSGKRVAFIGTGATGIQLAPQLAPQVEQLYVYQRTPIWLLPKPPLKFRPALKWSFRLVPGLLRTARLATASLMDLVFHRVFIHYHRMSWFGELAERICRSHIRTQVKDSSLHEELTPTYNWGCKRPSFSNDFYPMFNRENVELVTAPIERVTAEGVVTADGVERPVDVVICATGYQPFEHNTLPTYPVRGRDGLELRDYWDAHRYQAYRGFAVHGFPNFFLIFGPYSIPSTSYISMVELSTRNIISCIRATRMRDADFIEVTAEAQQEEWRDILERGRTGIWKTGNCATSNTYYIDRHGDTPTFRPELHPVAWWRSRRKPVTTRDFEIRRDDSDQIGPEQAPTERRVVA
jgi:cyclohexanone monooxygenase